MGFRRFFSEKTLLLKQHIEKSRDKKVQLFKSVLINKVPHENE